ncbi:hypothetical protein RvY_00904 [Ramazzottius varieornatus]|uniref:ceramide glucosyltransferase n=1 Tax=Ramazzottius varieornatus TaxID=947166 RepID=A0A1D1UEU0_RAMVA|nr:hypothetical protein RvY_00904 [Ramazzottius varieornatus]
MYHSGSILDILGVGLSIFIIIFWIGVWHVHLISIMYGKWRLHRSVTVQISSSDAGAGGETIKLHHKTKDCSVEVYSSDGVQLKQQQTDGGGSGTDSTIIQVHSDGEERSLTLFNTGMLPGVSVLKPLVGIDQYLLQNLETFFTMAYPKFELLFCVPDESDAAIMVVHSLMRKYPAVDARLFIGGENIGVNPKINNMMPAYRNAKYDLILVSDSAIMMREDTLLDMVSTMILPEVDKKQSQSRLYCLWRWVRNRGPTHGVGLVHQMPFSMDREEFGFPACLEKVYFGSAHARIYLAADAVGINCPTGMSALMRKHLLENKGGMAAFGKYLAEDYFFAKAITDQGWGISISSQPAWQNSAVCDLAHFQDRLDRWAKLRFAMVPLATLLEPFQECVLLGILASLAVSFLTDMSALGIFLLHVITWFLLDWTLLRTVQFHRLSYSKLDFIISWIFREVTSPVLFAKALLRPQIKWKNGYYRLKWGGLAEVIKTPHIELPVSSGLAVGPDLSSTDCNEFRIECSDLQPLTSSLGDNDELLSQQSLNGQEVPLGRFDLLGENEGEVLSASPSKSTAYRSRHVRSRSLPQRNPLLSVLSTISHKFHRGTTCDDLATESLSFLTKSERDIF